MRMVGTHEIPQFRLILISAMYENGGNYTHRLLDGHPQLMVYPFESQMGTDAGHDFLSSVVPIRYRWPEFPGNVTPDAAYEMFWDEELKTLLRCPGRSKFARCGLQMDERQRKESFCRTAEGLGVTRRNLVESYFRSTFEAWSNFKWSGQETTFVGYSPVLVLDTEKIFEDFPDAHVIHVVRNPYSAYAETKRRPFPLPLLRYAWTWNLCQQMALTYCRKFGSRFHLVRYEDLLDSPAETFGAALRGAGSTFSEVCRYPSFNGNRLDQIMPWGTIRVPSGDSNVATAGELSRQEKLQIRTETEVLLPLLGYGDFYDRYLV